MQLHKKSVLAIKKKLFLNKNKLFIFSKTIAPNFILANFLNRIILVVFLPEFNQQAGLK